MGIQEREFGDFKIRLFYKDCKHLKDHHRYFVECLDTRYWVKIVIDSNVIDKSATITMSDAIAKTKAYLRVRLDHRLYWEYFARP